MEWGRENSRYVFSSPVHSLPLYIESIGYSAWELVFQRPDGYPYYHWLHTLHGEGSFELHGETIKLDQGKGVLLPPFTPHSYFPSSHRWSTIYVTFGGAAAEAIMKALELEQVTVYNQSAEQPLDVLFNKLFQIVERSNEYSDMDASGELYNFLLQLRKFGMLNNQPSLSQSYRRLSPVVNWMEQNMAQNIGLQDISHYSGIGIAGLHELFQQAFDMSPYSYLLQLRLRQAKRIILNQPLLPLREVAEQTGFNDVSHFVATFRKKEGVTPGKYRQLYTTTDSFQR